jgi:hypothetical protein
MRLNFRKIQSGHIWIVLGAVSSITTITAVPIPNKYWWLRIILASLTALGIPYGFHLLKKKSDVSSFEKLAENERWNKESIGQKVIWICNEDNTFQIEIGENERPFTEPWTQVYPDRVGSWLHPVYLKVNGVTIKEISFIACDGGRIFVPLPEYQYEEDQHGDIITTSYVWNRQSLRFKIAKIIGEYGAYKTIEGIAKKSKITII